MRNSQSIDNYIDSFAGTTKAYLQQIRMIIQAVVPTATGQINYNIAAFALVEGGKRDQQIMMAGYKNHVGFYPHLTTIAHFKAKLSKFKHAKGSVQFPLSQPLPEALIWEMVKYRKGILTKKEII
ncbi:MAG: DUF1801 domain-containing protein [Bacteroidota bacterium]